MSDPRSGVVWIDGRVVDVKDARISILDHGLLYGDGLFEGMRVYGGRVFRLDRHLARLAAGARALSLALPGGTDALREIVLATARAHGGAEAYIRLIVTRGEGALGVDPTSCPHPRILCLVDRVSIYPEEKVGAGIDLVTASLRRPPPDVLDPRVKSLNYLNNALAKGEARRQGADDALLLNREGQVAEAAVANVFVVREGALWTPPGSDGALEGINRATVLELARELGIATAERSLGRFDLFAAEEVFLTGSGVGGLVPVRSLDREPVGAGPGPVFRRLRAAFEACKPRLGVSVS
ncbi:MAG TPA: branched-chain-amino-acid transaminase [Myxococcota bacterium]|nr:branched-chain-amino-acid transaminase [Myxococcota bacterium]